MHAGTYRAKRASDRLELMRQANCESPDGVLETELWSSVRAETALNC